MLQTTDHIVITGAAGFIASVLAEQLNLQGFHQLTLVDDFSRADKLSNHQHLLCRQKIHRNDFITWAKDEHDIKAIIHLGARTDTTEMNYAVHKELNLDYTKAVWTYCTERQIPLLYASSAATYGNGEFGYVDDHEIVSKLQPLNPYGVSKNEFDKWTLQQTQQPPFWAGLKFFNVYGPNEYHKGRMASVIFHAFRSISETGSVKLFRSHNPDYRDGEQIRDFIYVKDVVQLCTWLMDHRPASGLYNSGTGIARTFNDLVHSVFA
ncbi:MAG: ADP-glyceromanno-heptose 6-epimerase, partial [Chitinophagaceae bacterium]|nr:ADP-glyceromanno-heptose 6-epimerase [Chitinophagaceae bacterium]